MVQNLKAKYEGLPEDIRSAIDSNDIPKKLQDIGLSQGLHIDQIGVLEEETALVMLGVSHPNDFVERIENRLGVSSEKAIDIATAVNIQVFLSIRKSLMKLHEEAPRESEEKDPITKENILAEIEDRPTVQAKPQTQPAPAVSRPDDFVTKEHKDAAHGFIANALAGNAAAPAQKASIELRPKEPEKPKGYASDPYREPLS